MVMDLLYANVKNAITSAALPPLGRSDHILVLLTPNYTPIVQQHTTKTIRRWTQEACETLQDCFDWDVPCETHGDDMGRNEDNHRPEEERGLG